MQDTINSNENDAKSGIRSVLLYHHAEEQ
jgi:hypothetical protein